jgi:hypothetical protein
MPPAREPDPSLRRVQRDAAVIATVVAAIALVLQGGRPEGALGVLAGAALMGFSFAAIKGGVTALLARAAAGRAEPGRHVSGRRVAWTMVTVIGRYAVVGVVAWAVLVPLRAHPLGLFAGVTAPVAAIGIEAARLARGASRRGGGQVP